MYLVSSQSARFLNFIVFCENAERKSALFEMLFEPGVVILICILL